MISKSGISFAAGMASLAELGACDRSAPTSPAQPTVSTAAHASDSAEAAWFEDVALERGVDFTWRSGHDGVNYLFPETIGGGAAFFDMDADDDLDLYLVQGGDLRNPGSNPPNVLLRNRGDGFFDDVTSAAGDAGLISRKGYGMGVACGDYDNDADVDLYVTAVGPNTLLRNNADGTFSDVTASAGVGHPGWGTSAAFLDFDRDGDLDLYSCNYLNWSPATELECFNGMGARDYCSPNNYSAPAMDVLYRNEGDGTFVDVTITAGLDEYFGNGLGVVCGDFNTDDWIDVFVANDGMRNQLWLNRKNGTFIDAGLQTGCALDLEGKAKAGMGTHAADIDDDGDLDIIVCNLRRESDSVFINARTHFSDETTRAGLRVITRSFTRFGVGWLDFDNDGSLDLYQANGLVMREDRQLSSDPYAQPNLLFRGMPNTRGVFDEVRPRGGTRELLVTTSRAAAFGDIDNDGAIDILVVNRDARAHLLRNVTAAHSASAGEPNHWMIFRVVDEHGRDALGASVRVRVGKRVMARDVRAAYSYLASNDPRVHVGLGAAIRADEVAVRWTDGSTQSFGPMPADQIHTLRRKPKN